MFVTWLHTEAGYTLTGGDSIYALTLGEIRTLFDGYNIMKRQQELQQKGVSPGEQAAFRDFADGVNSRGGE